MVAKLCQTRSSGLICLVFLMLTKLPTSYAKNMYPHPNLLRVICSPQSTGGVQDVGCRSAPVNGTPATTSKNQTAIECVIKCWESEHTVASVVGGTDCFCSKHEGEKATEDQCDITCPKAEHQICGGRNTASVYRTGFAKLNISAVLTLYWNIRKTFYKDLNQRTASMQKHDGQCVETTPQEAIHFTSKLMRKELCVEHCYHYRHVYALLTGGVDCVCTSRMPEGDAHFAPSQCTVRCRADPIQICGGPKNAAIYTVYLTGYFDRGPHLNQGDFVSPPCLYQIWDTYLPQHVEMWRELIRLGYNLLPGQAPDPAENSVAEDAVGDTVVDEEIVDDGGTTGIIVGAVAGGIVGLISFLLVIIFSWVSKVKKKKKASREERSSLVDDEDG